MQSTFELLYNELYYTNKVDNDIYDLLTIITISSERLNSTYDSWTVVCLSLFKQLQRTCLRKASAVWPHYLPAAVGDAEQREGDGRARHGVGGGHAVLRVVEHLHLDHGRRGGSRPPDHILGALAEAHDPGPHHDQLPAHQHVHVPHDEGEEDDVEELVAQLRSEREQVVQEAVLDHELLAGVSRQRVLAKRLQCAAPRGGTLAALTGVGPTSSRVGVAVTARVNRITSGGRCVHRRAVLRKPVVFDFATRVDGSLSNTGRRRRRGSSLLGALGSE